MKNSPTLPCGGRDRRRRTGCRGSAGARWCGTRAARSPPARPRGRRRSADRWREPPCGGPGSAGPPQARPPRRLGARLPHHGSGGSHGPRRADPGSAQEAAPGQTLLVCRSCLAVPADGHGDLLVCPPVQERPDSTASAANQQPRENIVLITTHTHRAGTTHRAHQGRERASAAPAPRGGRSAGQASAARAGQAPAVRRRMRPTQPGSGTAARTAVPLAPCRSGQRRRRRTATTFPRICA